MSRLALVARALTLFRFIAIPPYVAMLRSGASPALAVLWIAVAASDFADGRIARRARATAPVWGKIDAAADISFNAAALGAAAAAGFIAPWAAIAVVVMGVAFLARRTVPERSEVDRPGKLAGVLFYALGGLVTLEAVWPDTLGAVVVRRSGDLVALYAAGVVSARFAMSSWRR